MTDSTDIVSIDYYTDLLCIWAWIAQPRLDELHRQWGDRIRVRHRFVDVFGDSHRKIKGRPGKGDVFEIVHNNVVRAAAPFEHVHIHEDVWRRVRPRSSLSAHLVLKAVQIDAGDEAADTLAMHLRQAFFGEACDIGDMDCLLDVAGGLDIDSDGIEGAIADGRALADLSDDQRCAGEAGVRGSPTWVLNENRQVLYGNVGYRILSANVEELLKHPAHEASWC